MNLKKLPMSVGVTTLLLAAFHTVGAAPTFLGDPAAPHGVANLEVNGTLYNILFYDGGKVNEILDLTAPNVFAETPLALFAAEALSTYLADNPVPLFTHYDTSTTTVKSALFTNTSTATAGYFGNPGYMVGKNGVRQDWPAQWSLNQPFSNPIITGTVAAIPTPAPGALCLALTGVMSAAGFYRRRRLA